MSPDATTPEKPADPDAAAVRREVSGPIVARFARGSGKGAT